MRLATMIVGVLLLIAGAVMAAGMFRYEETDKVADFGRFELEASREKSAPVNWGYVLMGGGALVLVGGALMRRAR